MQKKKIFIFLAVFWLMIIGGFIAIKEYTLRTGEEVLLKTIPVDPRDLFRGDYVILRYDISTIDTGSIQSDKGEFKKGDRVYLSLGDDGKYAIAKALYVEAPKEGLYIKGTVRNVRGTRLSIEYGIESYFVPEGEGKRIERQIGRTVEVKASISKSGHAVIKALLIDGQEVKFD